ncbi:MAG: hypothetical protein ACRC6T_02755 [Sarcina sp.]
MDKFVNLVQSIFPGSVTPYIAKQAKESLKQFKKDNKFGKGSEGLGREYDFFDLKKVGFLRQGDIIEGLNYFYISETGEQKIIRDAKMMIISNTCDSNRVEKSSTTRKNPQIHLVPLVEVTGYLDEIEDKDKRASFESDIYNNLIFRFIHLPHNELNKYVVNLNLITSLPLSILSERISDGACNIKYSLNDVGFYFLLCKLTAYFMREEVKSETNRGEIA